MQSAIPALFEQRERAEQDRASAALAAQLESTPSPSHAVRAHSRLTTLSCHAKHSLTALSTENQHSGVACRTTIVKATAFDCI